MSTYNNKIPAVVYPYETPCGIGIIRSLAVDNIPILGLNHRKNFSSLSSCFKSVICPDIAQSTDDFISFLIVIGEKMKKAVLYVGEDIAAFLISQYKNSLAEYYLYPYLEEETRQKSLNKWLMFNVAKDLGIPTPDTILVRTIDDITDRKNDLVYPVLIKPIFSTFVFISGKAEKVNEFRHIYNHAKVLQANSYDELIVRCSDVLSQGFQILLQEKIEGEMQCLYESKFYVNLENKIVHITTTRKIRQMPADFGICSFGVMEDVDSIKQYTENFLRAINFKGIVEMEFKYDSRDKQYKFIEINPRPNHWMSILTFNGINYPLMQYHDLTQSKEVIGRCLGKKKNWICLMEDLRYLIAYRKKSSEHHISLSKWFKTTFSLPLVEPFLSWDDPLLSLFYLGKCLCFLLKEAIKGIIYNVFGIKITKRVLLLGKSL